MRREKFPFSIKPNWSIASSPKTTSTRNVSSSSPTTRSASKSSRATSSSTLWAKSTNYRNISPMKASSRFSLSSRMDAKSNSGSAQKPPGRKSMKDYKSSPSSHPKFTSLLSVTMKIISSSKKTIRGGNCSTSFNNSKGWESCPCNTPKTTSPNTRPISKF